jgi:hypothetical protein
LRIQRLRDQLQKDPAAASGLQLVRVDDIPRKAGSKRAKKAWQALRRELAAGDSVVSEERFYAMTLKRVDSLSQQGSEREVRSLIETALEYIRDPCHQQVLHARMSTLAVLAGDTAAAEAWLARCNPFADDLEMDSAYRIARALVATALEHWAEVIKVLGRRPRDVPIARACDDVCSILRANALDRQGSIKRAARDLLPVTLTGRLDPLLSAFEALHLCPSSRALAIGNAERLLSECVAVKTPQDVSGKVVFYSFVIYGSAIAIAAAWAALGGIEWSQFGPLVPVGFTVIIVGGVIWYNAIFQPGINRTSVRGRARLLRRDAIDGLPPKAYMSFLFLVRVRGREDFVATYRANLSNDGQNGIRVGETIAIDVVPERRIVRFHWTANRPPGAGDRAENKAAPE